LPPLVRRSHKAVLRRWTSQRSGCGGGRRRREDEAGGQFHGRSAADSRVVYVNPSPPHIMYHTLAFSTWSAPPSAAQSSFLTAFSSGLPTAPLRPMSQPQPRRVLTTFGVTAAVRGTRTKMKLLWMA